MRLAISTTETLTDLKTDLVVANNNNNNKHESLVELLQSLDVDKSETRLLTNLYWKQTAAVRCGNDIREWLDIKQGVRQGCVASPHLFAL